MASGPDPGGRSRFAKLGMAINEELTQACRDVLEIEVPPGLIYSKVKTSLIYKKIRPEQELRLIGAKANGYKEFDITLLYTLIRNICRKIPPPTKGWGGYRMPSVGEITIGDDVERIRLIRNNMYGNVSSASLSQTEFDDTWSIITDICQRLQTYTKKNYMSGLRNIQSQALKEEDEATLEKISSLSFKSSLKQDLQKWETKYENKDAIDIPPERFLAYFRNRTTKVRHARGIVVGCGGAGKTTLLYRLMGKSINEIKDIKSTRGLQVYEHIFFVKNGDLSVTEDEFLKKPLIRFPESELEHMKENSNDDSAKNEMEREIGNNSSMDAGEELADQDQWLTEDVGGEILYTKENERNAQQLVKDAMEKILDAREKETSVSIIDFAGQFAYYACHQIYMRSEAFYVLVLDMSKDFQDVVKREIDECEDSIFSTWSYKEYLYFWLDSIKTFGGSSPKILVVATHAESKTNKERNFFWKRLWTLLPPEDKKWFRDCTDYQEFALELIDMSKRDSHDLQSLKYSIAKVVSQGMDTEIEVPSAWALLEHFLKKTEKPILSISDINKVNEKLPNGYQLKSQEEIFDFLSFFHGHGMLLFFKGQELSTHAILDIQWFSNAFSKLIADENHISKDCQRIYIEEWNNFNATGNLKNSLVDALWEGESYVEHKRELMSYMERLRMLVSIQVRESDISWYVPCMNNKPFTRQVFDKEWEYSSVLSFRFKSFALFVYYRLIAYCMSLLRWNVQMDNDNSPCLYHTAAIFETENHIVLVGIFENDIQVQVLRIKNLQQKESCLIGKTVENALTELTNTFEKQTFQKGYKCLNVFCSKEDTTFIPENELSGIQCNCPVGKEKHEIKEQWTLAFWKEMVSSTGVLEDRSRFAKLGMAITDVLTETLRDVLEKEIPSTHIYVKVNSTILPKGVKGPNPEQKKRLVDAKNNGYQEFDITLLYLLIRNYCSTIPQPTNNWGLKVMPGVGETTIGDDVERIRLIRNEVYGHVSSASAQQAEFDDNWSIIYDICKRLEVWTGKSYLSKLDDIKELTLGKDRQEAIIKEVKVVCERDPEILERMQSIETGIQSIKKDLQEIKLDKPRGRKEEEEAWWPRWCGIL